MNQSVDPVFAAALRRELVAHVSAKPRRIRHRLPIALGVGALALGGTVAATHLATADSAAAPLAEPVVVNGVGATDVVLPGAPAGATYLRFELTCYDGPRCYSPLGGLDGRSSFVKVERGAVPLTDTYDPSYGQIIAPLDPQQGFPVDVAPGTHWRLYAVYTDTLDPALAHAGPGKTLLVGIPNNVDIPDLVPLVATNGRAGYVDYRLLTTSRATVLDGTRPELTSDGTRQPPLPVYGDDGTTVIGYADVSAPYVAPKG
jgi:hypothetical protein